MTHHLKHLKRYGLIALLGFVLNLVWENAQAPLYAGYTSFTDHFLTCLRATLGDAAIVLLLSMAYTFAAKERDGMRDTKRRSALAATAIVITGIIIAILIEWHALAAGRWSYAAMLLIPLLNVGLLPILQLALLPLATVYIAEKVMGTKARGTGPAATEPNVMGHKRSEPFRGARTK